jgi:hypothetical protein
VLAPLDLAADYDAGRDVSDADGGFDFVNVLTAFAAGAECIDAEIFGTDVDFDFVVHFGYHKDGSEGSVTAGGLVEGRDADQAVHSGFANEHAIGIFTGELNRGVLDAGLFAGSFVEDDGIHAFPFRPTEIHAEQDRGPVLRFGATGAGLNGHDGVEVIAFAGKQGFGFQVGDVGFGSVELTVEFFEQIVALLGVGFFLGEVDVGVEIAGERREFFVGGNLFFGAFAVAQDGLGSFLVAPEIGLTDARFEGFQAFAMRSGVKDNSEPC